MKTTSLALAAGILTVLSVHAAPTVAKSPTASPEARQGEDKTERYVSLYVQGSRPLNRPVRLQDDPSANTDVQGGLGGGLKVGFFPAFTGRSGWKLNYPASMARSTPPRQRPVG